MYIKLVIEPDNSKTLIDIYTDNGTTGRTFERPAFEKMLSDVDTGKIDCIVVKDLSRLGRNTIDTGYYIEKYFPIHHVRFIAVNDQYDSEGEDNNGSHIIMPLKNMINEAYAADISKKVKSQAHQSMKDGDFIGARPPYGYKKAPDNCHKLIVNEDTAPIVQQIFEWTADGTGMNEIVKRLNEKGVLTPGHYLASIGIIKNQRLMGSGKWQTWTVSKILGDEVYTGDMVQGKTKAIGHKQVPTPPEEWIVVRGTHEPLVSRELFETVQAARKQAAERVTLYEVIYKQAQVILNLENLSNAGVLDMQLAKQNDYDRQIQDLQDKKRVLYEQLLLQEISMEEYKSQKAAIDVELNRIKRLHA